MRFNLPLLALIVVNAAGQLPVSPTPEGQTVVVQFVETHRALIQRVLADEFRLDPDLALSIALPEVSRYSRLRDLTETSALQVFYIQLGEEYADFSIGKLQMKPSFAASLESAAHELGNNIASMFEYKTQSPEAIREERVDRLCSIEWQLRYLGLFCRLVQHRNRLKLDDSTLTIYASAYNLGWQRPLNDIVAWSHEKNFPSGRREPTDASYASCVMALYDLLKSPDSHEE